MALTQLRRYASMAALSFTDMGPQGDRYWRLERTVQRIFEEGRDQLLDWAKRKGAAREARRKTEASKQAEAKLEREARRSGDVQTATGFEQAADREREKRERAEKERDDPGY